ncbi:hypothetical protein AB3S75_044947 [Citrus x aurantiifolia]
MRALMGFFCFNPSYYSVSLMDVMAVTALITAMPMPMPCLLLPFLGSLNHFSFVTGELLHLLSERKVE